MALVPLKDWNASVEVRTLIEQKADLRRLYVGFGYSAETDRRSGEILEELRALLRLEIKSFSSFQEYVKQVQREIEKCKRGEFNIPEAVTSPESRKLCEQMAHPLWTNSKSDQEWTDHFWKAAVRASKDERKISDLIKPLTVIYDDEWGGYMVPAKDRLPLNSYSFVAVTLTHPERFNRLLNELKECFDTGSFSFSLDKSPEAQEAYSSILAHIASLRSNLPNGSLWKTLCTVKREIQSAMRLEYNLTNQLKKEELDQILWDIVYTQHQFKTDPDSFRNCDDYKEDAAKNAKTLIETPWMQTPWLINYVLCHLLTTDLVALNGTANSRVDASRWTSDLPQPWGTIIPSLISFVFFLGSVVVIYALLEIDMAWLAYLGTAYLLWHYFWRFLRNYQFADNRGKVSQAAALLQLINNEVKTGHYQCEEVARRLRQLEEKNLYVHSLVYPLLSLSKSAS